MIGWWQRWRERRDCFHHSIHDRANIESWIGSRILDHGRKLYWCRRCDRRWVM